MQLRKKRLQDSCFPVKFAKFLRAPFLTEHLWWLLLQLSWLRLYFLKKVLLNSYFATLLWRTNIFFFSTRCLMYSKWKVLVCLYICRQLSGLTPSGCTLKAENWHAWSHEKCFSKHHYLDICRCVFKKFCVVKKRIFYWKRIIKK